MPEEQIKQDVANVVSIAKADASKVAGAISQVDVDAAKTKAAAMAKLNQEESWIEKNPRKVTLIFVALLGIIIVMLAKACA